MNPIRWVCLSDLHFGAENSLLSHLPAGSLEVDTSMASPVLTALVACLRDAVGSNKTGQMPTLVLNGDVLEFALASDNVAAMVFDRFVELAFDPAQPLFDPIVYYVPGNHDHHLWETARERQYADYVARVPTRGKLNPPWHVTRMFERDDRPAPTAELMTALLSRQLGHDNVKVRAVYPNLGFKSRDESSTIVFHHGHFIESIYLLMTELRVAMFPGEAAGPDVWDWEADNFAWIDFFWSTLGRSGRPGADVRGVYDMLQSPHALRLLAGNLGGALGKHMHGPALVGGAVSPILKDIFRSLAGRARGLERQIATAALSPSAAAGLSQYLNGPLRAQLNRERPGGSELRTSFVFGHTHKPFESLQPFDGYRQPVALFNTGGWAVDTAGNNPLQGAAVVLADDECNVASLRLYNQTEQADQYRVMLAPDPSGVANPLHARLAETLDFGADPWTTFSAAVAEGVSQRQRALPQIIQLDSAATTSARPSGAI